MDQTIVSIHLGFYHQLIAANQKVIKHFNQVSIIAISRYLIIPQLLTELCALNYCQDGLQVYFDTGLEEYLATYLGGYYEIQAIDINGRPYFEMINGGFYGLWWDGIDSWWIGYEFRKGQAIGFAYYKKDVFCPNLLSEWDWMISINNEWKIAEEKLGISCKCISIKMKIEVQISYILYS